MISTLLCNCWRLLMVDFGSILHWSAASRDDWTVAFRTWIRRRTAAILITRFDAKYALLVCRFQRIVRIFNMPGTKQRFSNWKYLQLLLTFHCPLHAFFSKVAFQGSLMVLLVVFLTWVLAHAWKAFPFLWFRLHLHPRPCCPHGPVSCSHSQFPSITVTVNAIL